MIFTIIPNRNCNLYCSYCYQEKKKNIVMSDTTITKTCDFIRKKSILSNNKIIKINISGGECLIYPEKIKNIISQLRKTEVEMENKIFEIEVSTNITLLTENMIIFFKKNHISLFLSFDGIKKSHNLNRTSFNKKTDTYKICNDKLYLLNKYKLKNIVLNSVITNNNIIY